MTKQNKTDITFLVDRSGSMLSIASDMEGGFQTFIDDQKKVTGECRVSLVLFDDRYEQPYTAMLVESVPKFQLVPRGSTALLDSLGKAIQDTGSRLATMKESDRPSQVLFVIVTDGQENASYEYTQKRVFDMITHQRETYKWEFIFLGANQDAIATATSLGVSSTNSVTYSANAVGSQCLMRGLSAGVSSYRARGQSTMNNVFDQQAYESQVVDVASGISLIVDVHGTPIVSTPATPGSKP